MNFTSNLELLLQENVLADLIAETAQYVLAMSNHAELVVRHLLLDSAKKRTAASRRKTRTARDPQAEDVQNTLLNAISHEFGKMVSHSHTKIGNCSVSIPSQPIVHVGGTFVPSTKQQPFKLTTMIQVLNK